MNWYKKSNDFSDLPVWDSVNGIGSVPWNQEVDYRGFVRMMTPSEFRSVVPPGSMSNSGKAMAELARKGVSFGPPFLEVEWDSGRKVWQVVGHEGRSRSEACEILSPGKEIPVHVFPKGMRARDLTDEMRSAPFLRQRG